MPLRNNASLKKSLRNASLKKLYHSTTKSPTFKQWQQSKPSGKAIPVKAVSKRSSLSPRLLTPLPVIVSTLNNKGVSYVEKRQYEEAKKSLNRALSMLLGENKEEEEEEDPASNIDAASPPQRGNETEGCCPLCFDHLSLEGSSTIPFNPFSSASAVQGSDNPKKLSKQRSEYDQGMDYFQDPLRLKYSSRSMDGTILFNLGRISHNQGNFDDALTFYKRSLKALTRWPTTSTTTTSTCDDEALTLAILFGIGHVQYIRGDHVDAFQTYMTSLSLARSAFGEDSLQVAACHNCIGVLHTIMPTGNSETALEALLSCLSMRRHLLGDHHMDVGITWNNLGRIYFQQAIYEMAQEAYLLATRIVRRRKEESEKRKCQCGRSLVSHGPGVLSPARIRPTPKGSLAAVLGVPATSQQDTFRGIPL
jgi:tetratricopeptide (TPR) repeat protein